MEYRKVCKVCGKIYCYNDSDIKSNNWNSFASVLGSVASIANAFEGNRYDMYETGKMADRANSKITDFSKCPFCGSRDIRDLTDDEYRDYQDGLIGDNGSKGSNAIQINTNASVDALIQRGMLFLEEGNWKTAQAYFDNALDADPTNSDAYIGKMMIDLRINTLEQLCDHDRMIDDNSNYIKALRFADKDKADEIQEIASSIRNNIEYKKNREKYDSAVGLLETDEPTKIDEAIAVFASINGFLDSAERIEECKKKKYLLAQALINKQGSNDIAKGIEILDSLVDYENSTVLAADASKLLNEVKEKEEKQKLLIEEENSKKRKKTLIFSAAVLVLLSGLLIVYVALIRPASAYSSGLKSIESGDYENAYRSFKKAGKYKDAESYLASFYFLPKTITYEAENSRSIWTMSYDNNGSLSKYVDDYVYFKTMEKRKESSEISYISADPQGRAVASRTQTEYGKETKTIAYGENTVLTYEGPFWKTVLTFDENMNLAEKEVSGNSDSHDNGNDCYETLEINSENRVVRRNMTGRYFSSKKGYMETITYGYDEYGCIVKVKFNDSPDYVIEYDVTYLPNSKMNKKTPFDNIWILIIDGWVN